MFVLFDVTGSTSRVRPRYLQDFDRILAAIQGGDVLVADRITENPLAQSEFPVNEVFPAFSLGVNKLRYDAEMRKKRKACQATVAALLNERRTLETGQLPSATRILDSLRLAERVFHAHPHERCVLVFFSDMVEQSSEHNFTSMSLDTSGIEGIIADEKAKGDLPDLRGVCVYVVGASAAKVGGMSSDRILAIENFWLRYFKECGADLSKDRYGSSLLTFSEP